MADLDDFFAKKDRSKKKNVKKFTTADEIAKKLEDPKQKTEVRKKERPAQDGEDSGRAGEEEEWKEYEEPVKDYTGLKIQVLQGGNGAPDSGREPGSEDCAPGEGGKVKGPWNKSQAEAEQPGGQPPPPEEPPAAAAAAAKPAERKPAAYVAPAARARPVEVPLRRNQQKARAGHTQRRLLPAAGRGGQTRRRHRLEHPRAPLHRAARADQQAARTRQPLHLAAGQLAR